VKHGRAAAIVVELEFRARDVVLRIRDNGAGFEPEGRFEQASGCFGLLGMRERAHELRGQLHVHSQPGQGAEIVVTAPLPEAQAAAAPALKLAPAH
jgi:signal transduction histidine kinase